MNSTCRITLHYYFIVLLWLLICKAFFFLSPTPTHLFLPNFFSIKTFRILLLSSWVWIMVLSFKMLTFLYHQTSYFSLLQLFAALGCLKSHNWCPSEKAIVNYIIYKHIWIYTLFKYYRYKEIIQRSQWLKIGPFLLFWLKN